MVKTYNMELATDMTDMHGDVPIPDLFISPNTQVPTQNKRQDIMSTIAQKFAELGGLNMQVACLVAGDQKVEILGTGMGKEFLRQNSSVVESLLHFIGDSQRVLQWNSDIHQDKLDKIDQDITGNVLLRRYYNSKETVHTNTHITEDLNGSFDYDILGIGNDPEADISLCDMPRVTANQDKVVSRYLASEECGPESVVNNSHDNDMERGTNIDMYYEDLSLENAHHMHVEVGSHEQITSKQHVYAIIENRRQKPMFGREMLHTNEYEVLNRCHKCKITYPKGDLEKHVEGCHVEIMTKSELYGDSNKLGKGIKTGDISCSNHEQKHANDKLKSKHVNSDETIHPYHCQICEEKFIKRQNLHEHYETIHAEIKEHKMICKECGAKFGSKNKFIIHFDKHQVSALHSCNKCLKVFQSLKDLKSHHKNEHLKRKTKKCEECPASFMWHDQLVRHKVRVHGMIPPHPCDKCSKRFSVKRDLNSHMLVHQTTKQFACEQCGITFSRQLSLKHHQKEHLGLLDYKCDRCPKAYARYSSLYKHQTEFHGATSVRYTCHVCSKGFWCVTKLNLHLQKHSDERPYNCHHCFKAFKTKQTCDAHIAVVHENSNHLKYHCNQCNKRFHSEHKLNEHEKGDHEGIKMYECENCGKQCGTKKTLLRHKRNHEHRFQCLLCPQSFPHKAPLDDHMNTHTGDKPYTCAVCCKGFAQRSTLTKHKRTHAK